jgi:hypothetical protein
MICCTADLAPTSADPINTWKAVLHLFVLCKLKQYTLCVAAAAAAAGIGVQTLGAMGMQWTTRAIGAAAVSSVSSLRLVAAVVGSVIVLHETPTHPLVWSGFVVVVLTMAAYTAFQYRGTRAPQQQDAAAANSLQLPAGDSSSGSSGQLTQFSNATGGAGCPHDCSLQEDARRAALLSAAGSDPSCQLFLPLQLLDSTGSTGQHSSSTMQQASSRSNSVPVFAKAVEAGADWDLEGQHMEIQQQQQRSRSMMQPGR